jgi:exopolysaccharide biosynthesis polyprenyl glycosylphosphotransferase
MNRLKQITLLIGDLVTMYIGLYFAIFARYLEWPSPVTLSDLILPMTKLFFFAVIINFISGLYDLGHAKNTRAFYQRIAISAGVWFVFGILYFYINPRNDVTPKTILILTTVFSFGLVAIWRFFYNKFISTAIWQWNVVFAGFNDEVLECIKLISKEPQRGYITKGLLLENDSLSENIPLNIATAKTIAELNQKIQPAKPNLIVVSPSMADQPELLKNLYENLFNQISVISLADFYENLMGRIPPFTFSEAWFITNLHEQQKKIYDRARIVADYFTAVIVGLFFIATFPFVALAIKLTSPGPIFYKQKRIGQLGSIFTIYKYRTMKALAEGGSAEIDGPQFADKGDARITKVGKFLRKVRLDEIPQFYNILKGEMRIIGPRPERPEFVDLLQKMMPYFALRHLIKPGLTGWAQIHKAYYGTLEENLRKLEYDLYYIKNRGLILDAVIFLRTINIVARFKGR